MLVLNPHDSHLRLRRGDLYLKANKPDEALKDYESILTDDPDNVSALAGKGQALAQKGDRRAGAEQLQKALGFAKDPKQQQEIREKLRALGVGPLL
jgi:tetratricopeptide (TPR) repeat protein